MKFLHSLLIFAATVLAANPQLLGGLHDRAVYPEEGEVCCRRDGAKNCVSGLLPPPLFGWVYQKDEKD
ncbi:hypothetical protein CSOJ01_02881 [Colletotrichum sojae]|uniref:Uncharacterized protein n=1 Tax=Colletotrichum sojae TaxID=2175907 RepID=A0A8H6N142_9PEZI|nr:hypothetical protein CSOJ01_02881 [Colletotrichum sojae]